MTQKEPDYKDEQGHNVHETWNEGKLISIEVSAFGDYEGRGYYEKTDFDNLGKKIYHIIKTPTPQGFNELEEHFDQGFLISQTERIKNVIKSRHYYSQSESKGQEVLKTETVFHTDTGKVEVSEFLLTGEKITPSEKRIPLTLKWKSKNR